MKKLVTEEEKIALLDGHFYYEVNRIIEDLSGITVENIISPNRVSIPETVLVDFLVHIRILDEFFHTYKNDNTANAGDYIESWKTKEAPLEIKKDLRKQINNFLSHLTYGRVKLQYNEYKIFELYKYFKTTIIQFIDALPHNFKTKRMKDLRQKLNVFTSPFIK